MARNDGALKADSIGAVEAAAQSFGSMSPIMALCLVTPIIAAGAGLATPAAIMLAGIASLLCGRTIARFASRWSSAGSLLTYATVSLGPSWGLYSGIVYTTAMSLLTVGGVAFLATLRGHFPVSRSLLRIGASVYYFAGDRFDLLPGRAAINTCAAADQL